MLRRARRSIAPIIDGSLVSILNEGLDRFDKEKTSVKPRQGLKEAQEYWKPGDPRENPTPTKSDRVDFIPTQYQKQRVLKHALLPSYPLGPARSRGTVDPRLPCDA